MSSVSYSRIQKSFLRYQHIFVLIAPIGFITTVLLIAPTPTSVGIEYWLQYWWLFPAFLLGATMVNTVGISGSAVFVPFLIFIFPLFAQPLEPETLVKVGLISEAFGLSSSAVAFIQHGLVDRRLAVTLVAGAVPFVIGGALLSFIIPEPLFHGLLAVALLAASYLLFQTDLDHEHEDETSDEDIDTETSRDRAASDGGVSALPDDNDKLGPAGVNTDENGQVTRVDRQGDEYQYTRAGYFRRFGNYSIGGIFQGLAGFGVGELGIISMLGTKVPVRVAIGTNHIVVALTAVLASVVHVFGGGLVGGHSISLASTPWNMVVFTVPATVLGGQIAPYVSNALSTDTIKTFVGGLFAIIAIALFMMAAGGI